MWFKRKKNVEIDVAGDYESRLTVLEVRINKIAREHVEFEMDLDNFRDKVLRKIQNKRKDNKDEDEPKPLDGLPRL